MQIREFESKGQWRGWIWRQLKTTAEGPLLYLPGKDNLDAVVAEAFGIDLNRLIAIDRAGEAIETARAMGTIAIQGDLQEILAAWPDDWEIAGLNADLFSCLSGDAIELLPAIRRPPIKRRVAINLQRGRENVNGWWDRVSGALGTNHRGVAWLWLRCQLEAHKEPDDAFVERIMDACNPQFASYRSNVVTMDSVVFNVPSWFGWQMGKHESGSPDLRRRIAAARAVMTRRTNANVAA